MYKKMNLKIMQTKQANFLNCESIIYITEDFQPQREQLQNTRPLHLHVSERFEERGITQ